MLENGSSKPMKSESEPKVELDRFADAMIAIRDEIRAIECGDIHYEDSALNYAPHTASVLAEANWDRNYSRETAVFPVSKTRATKYWPPVGRIDNVHGDRNLICSCPPIENYENVAD